jgi:hypothetical protein
MSSSQVGTGAFDWRVGEAMREARSGAVLLLELRPPWPLQVQWLEHQLAHLSPGAVLHDGGAVLAVLAPGLDAGEAWTLMQQLRDRAEAHRLQLIVGLATWPMQGSTPVEVVAAAAAALVDEHARSSDAGREEVLFEVDGHVVTLGLAGELLTG